MIRIVLYDNNCIVIRYKLNHNIYYSKNNKNVKVYVFSAIFAKYSNTNLF